MQRKENIAKIVKKLPKKIDKWYKKIFEEQFKIFKSYYEEREVKVLDIQEKDVDSS